MIYYICFFKKNKYNKCYQSSKEKIEDIDKKIEYENWSEGHIFTNSIWMPRNKYLKKVSEIIGDGKCIHRDGTKNMYNSFSFISPKNNVRKNSLENIYNC